MAVHFIVVHTPFGRDTHGASEVDVKGFTTKESARAYIVARMTEDLNEAFEKRERDDDYKRKYEKIREFTTSNRDHDDRDSWEIREFSLGTEHDAPKPSDPSTLERPFVNGAQCLGVADD